MLSCMDSMNASIAFCHGCIVSCLVTRLHCLHIPQIEILSTCCQSNQRKIVSTNHSQQSPLDSIAVSLFSNYSETSKLVYKIVKLTLVLLVFMIAYLAFRNVNSKSRRHQLAFLGWCVCIFHQIKSTAVIFLDRLN